MQAAVGSAEGSITSSSMTKSLIFLPSLLLAVFCISSCGSSAWADENLELSEIRKEMALLRERVEVLEKNCGCPSASSTPVKPASTVVHGNVGRALLDTIAPLSGNVSQSGTQFSEVVVDSGLIMQDITDPSDVVTGTGYNMLFANGGKMYFRSSTGELHDVLEKEVLSGVNGSAPFWFTDPSLKLWHTFESDTIVGAQYQDKASSLITRDGAGSHSSTSGINGLGVYSASSNYLLTGYTIPQGDRSVSFWVKFTAFTGGYQLMGVQLGSGHFYIGMYTQNPIELFTYVGNQGGSIEGYALYTNRWYHMGLTMGQNIAQIYLDGEVVSTISYNDVTSVAEYAIGGLQNGDHRQEAVIDELKVWDRVVSPSEMREVYDHEKQSDVKESVGQTQPWVNDPTLRVWHTFDSDTIVGGGQYRDLAAGIVTSDLTGSHSSTNGFIGEALRSTSSNILDINYYNPLNEKTVTYWIKYNSFVGQYGLMGTQNGGAYFYLGVNSNQQVYYYAGYSTGGTVSSVTLSSGVWYWFGMKMSGSVVKIFHDGSEILSQTYSVPNARLKFAIGGLQNQGHPMDVTVDEFKYWSRSLADSDLVDIYQYETAVGNH